MQPLKLIKKRPRLGDLDNLAVAVLGGVVLLLSSIVICSEALTPGPSEGTMDLFGWRVGLRCTREQFNLVLAVGAALGAAICIAGAFIKKESRRLQRWLFFALVVLVVACITSATLKYCFIRPLYFDAGDAFSYYLGPKYFKELGYDLHYECAAAAQMENGTPLAGWGRDLRTNVMKPIRRLATPKARQACRNRFTERRWESFKHDVALFRYWHGQKGWRYRFRDHGYNGTPVYQLIAGAVANGVTLSHRNMVLLSLLNLWMVFVMLAVVIKAFGWRFGLLFSLLFWTNFLERWLLGGAFLRYEWIAAIVIGISLVRMGRYAAAGVFLAFAAGVKIFPVLLFGGIIAVVVWDLVRGRGVKPEHKRLLAGAAVTGVVLGVLSVLHGHGFRNWPEFFHQMEMNSGRFSTMRVGFVYNFIWPKEVLPADPVLSYITRVRAMEEPFFLCLSLNHVRWILTGVLAFFVLKNLKRLDDIARMTLSAFFLFFTFFVTVRYYYSGFLGLPFMWHDACHRRAGKLFMAYLLAVSALGYLMQQITVFPFTYNTFFPAMLTVYLVVYIVYIEIEGRCSKPGGSEGTGQ
jgi:hypothetical protein